MRKFKPTPMQEAMLYEMQNTDSRYITKLRYTLDKSADAEKLSQRLALLVARHEILRTKLVRDDDGLLWQEVGEQEEGHFRVSLSKSDELTIEFNHAMLDGWSVGILMRELMAEEEPDDKPSPFRYYGKWLERRDSAADLKWWKDYLHGTGSWSELPNRTSRDGYERRELRFALECSEQLRDTAKELKTTAGRLLQAVWCMLMARYNGGMSVVCTVNSGRSAPVPGITGMAGLCINTLPLVTALPKPTESVRFSDWLSHWNHRTTEAEKHGFCSLGDLMSGKLPHILSIDPPFDGAGYKLVSSSAELVTDFDAAFTLGDTIRAEFAYNACVYSNEAVRAVQGHFLTALYAVLDNPDIPVEQIPILTGAEITELTAPHEDAELLNIIERQTVVDFWRESVILHGSREALVYGDVRLTYSELSDTVERVSDALRARGVTAETPVAILLPRSERYVIAELAILTAGGFFIPLDTEWPEARITTILNEVNPALTVDEAVYNELLSFDRSHSTANSPLPRHAAYMILTSGTTGTPKGVVIEHRSLANFCLWAKARYGWQPGDSCALELGFAFDGSLWSIWLPLISGGTLHILSDAVRFDLRALGETCRTEHITHLDLPVTMAEAFREIYSGDNALPDLRVMVTGGEEVRRVVSASCALSNEYGPTECTVCCSAGWLSDSPITVGSPVPNMNAYILDEWGRLCPDGVTGEAYYSGVQVARGYYNAPELTAERFTSNPFVSGQIMYRTGDLMYCNEHSELVFAGRMDNQVKINGFRIELGEIETVLRSHGAVRAAAAFVREKQLCAYVVPSGVLDKSELYELTALKLLSFMRPVITIVDNIPLTSSGKVDVERLIKEECTAELIAPSTENEKILVSAVSRLLGGISIGVNHNYLELGGNSINAMRISFCLEKEGYALSAKDIITSVSLADAAVKMGLAVANETGEVGKVTVFTPLAAQQAMLFLAQAESSAMYTVTVKLDANGLDAETLKNRLDKAAALHDILRASFEQDETGKIVGRIHEAHSIRLNADDSGGTEGLDPLGGSLVSLTLADNVLTLCYHHIALDGFSVSLLVQELLFGKFPEAAPSFAEFANRLSAQTERQKLDEAWWRESIRDATAVPLIPPKTEQPAQYKRVLFAPPELLAKCADAAKAARVTPAAFTLAAWGVTVNALGGEDDSILLPFVASCRNDDALMGMCAQTLPCVFNLMDEPYSMLAKRVQDAMLESVSHWFADILGKLPDYLFVFEDDAAGFTAEGEQNYDLVVKISDKGELIYNAARVPEVDAERIAACLEAALTAVLEDHVSVLSNAEYELVTQRFARGRTLTGKHKTAAEAFTAAAETYAERIALETESGSITYAELYRQARELADKLGALGIGMGDIVAFALPRNAEGILAQLGIMLSGAAFLPLDPAWPENRTADILRDSGAAAVLKDGLAVEMTGLHGKVPPDSAYIIYTSGTTGRPKGVLIPQAALSNQIWWAIDEFGFTPDDKHLHYIAFAFDPSVWVTFTTLCAGAVLSLLPEEARLDPNACARQIIERGITRCTLPSAAAPEILRRVTASRLRTVFLGGEAIQNLPSGHRGYEVVNCYGPTEACINAAFYQLPPGETETRVIGQPVANTCCYVLDIRGQPCPVGVPGELCIGGIQLAHGYINRPEESAAVFSTHPQLGRLYKTGDRAVWSKDGTLTFIGRRDEQVKIRGHRVELTEIEYALRELPGISEAKVIYTDSGLDAYLVTTGVADVSALTKRLPSYMLPRSVTVMESFPLTANGKIDVSAFPAPTTAITKNAESLSDMENTIASAWRTALGLVPEYPVGRGDSFTDLGGHSLLLFHVVGLLSAAGIHADIRTLIEHPVLADAARAISQMKVVQAPKHTSNSAENEKAYRLYVKQMEQLDISETRDFRNVLITGGTGFLGSHLLREFYDTTDAVLHLPVRGDLRKLRDTLTYYFGTHGLEMAASNRLRVYLTDISEKPPDIDTPLDAIFHTAADIRHYAPESDMYRGNVSATDTVIALARRHPGTLLAHVSTTSAVNAPVIWETDRDLGPDFENIYQRTKQIAEQHVLDAGKRGLRYAVFRVGHVSPGYESGSVARNWEINAMLRLTNAMLLTEALPEQDYQIGYGYVDVTARAIRLLSSPVKLSGHVFHIDNPNTLRLSEIFRLAGLRGTVLPKDELIARLTQLADAEDGAVGQAAREYLGRLSQGSLEKDSPDIVAGKLHMDATLLLLKRLGFTWPHVTEEYVKRIVNSLKGGAASFG